MITALVLCALAATLTGFVTALVAPGANPLVAGALAMIPVFPIVFICHVLGLP